MASPGWAMVERVVDSVLESLPDPLRILCDRSGILVALEGMGAISLPLLSTLMEEDYMSVKMAIGSAAKPAFVAALKARVIVRPTEDESQLTSPPPLVALDSATVQQSVVVTVKIGPKVVVSARMLHVLQTTSFAELRNMAIAEETEAVRAQLATLPLTVLTFSGAQHLSTQRADAQLSALVHGSISLGYKHIVFAHAAPAQQPAPNHSANAFARIMGGNSRPERETVAEGAVLPFDKALLNWLIDMCEVEALGVQASDVGSLEGLLKAVRDGLQAMDAREGQFQYGSVPERFKQYKTAVVRAKKPAKRRLERLAVQGYADRLRGAIDNHSFTRAARWAAFVGDCNELHKVLSLKHDAMRGAATMQNERDATLTINEPDIKPITIDACEAGTIERYASLEQFLLAKPLYEIIQLTEDDILTFHPPSETIAGNPDRLRKHFQIYRDNIMFHSIAFKKFPATFGGTRKMMLFLWRVPTDAAKRMEADNDRTVQNVKKLIPELHSRAVRLEFSQRYSHAVVTKSVLRSMYTLLTNDGSGAVTAVTKERDLRALEFVVANGDIELWPDLRALNSGEREKFNAFWDAGSAVLLELESCAAENRHGDQRTLLTPLSVPDFRRRAVEKLASNGHPDAAVPTDKWISFQFQPRCPTRDIATRFTGRWEITLKILCTVLRKFNVDAHYCNALELNVKAFLREADGVLQQEFEKLREEHAAFQMECEELPHLADVGDWGPHIRGDGHISKDDVIAYLETAARIVRVSNDDKCKVPTGEPANPVGMNVRPMSAALALTLQRLLAMDHSWHRASITPTVTLITDLSHAFETNKWRNGQICVTLKDSVLEPSSAFRNAAELSASILEACPKPIIVDKRSDGGPEQNTTFGSVQLADVALWKKTGADLVIHQRPAADNSYVNEVEGCMPLFNLAMQHQASARLQMDDKFEALLANEGSMSAIREKIAAIADEGERAAAAAAWLASLHGSGSPIELLEARFGRLEYTGRRVKVESVAAAEEIATMHDLIKVIEPEWEPTMTTKAALAILPRLQRFLSNHTIRDKYIVSVFKCGDSACEFGCGPLRMPRAAFDALVGGRLAAKCKIVPHPEHTAASGKDSFDKYANLKDRPTSEKHMPSFKRQTEASMASKKADQATAKRVAEAAGDANVELWHAAKARLLIHCSECNLPRCLYSLTRLSPDEKALAQSAIDDVSSFVCGATEIFEEGGPLASKLFVRAANACGLPVEKQYFTSKQFINCCSWCATTDPLELQDLAALDLHGAKAYSICKRCYADGQKVVTFGKPVKTAARKNKAKGRKRQKTTVDEEEVDAEAVEEEEEEEEEEVEDEDEEADEGGGGGEEESGDESSSSSSSSGSIQYTVEIVLAKKRVREPRKGLVTKWAIKWQGYDEMTWEPAENLASVRAELEAFERRQASMPAPNAITAGTSSSGPTMCCFGSTCLHQSNPDMTKIACVVCGDNLHNECAAQHPFLAPFYEACEGSLCFDCALLVALVEKRTPFGVTGAQLMFEPYYRQLRGIASLAPSPFALGALLATKSLKLLEPNSLMARQLPAVAKCTKCKSAEGALRACSFCKAIYHDTVECLGLERGPKASINHKTFPWCCPKCFKKGTNSLEKALLQPPIA